MEENIKILEGYLDRNTQLFEDYGENAIIQDKEIQAIENLIKGYREYKNFYHRRLKEWRTKFENQEKHFLNELDEYDEEREKLKKQLDNSIPKSKVKEKIEELQESKEFAYRDEEIMFKKAIQVLQELMEDK